MLSAVSVNHLYRIKLSSPGKSLSSIHPFHSFIHSVIQQILTKCICVPSTILGHSAGDKRLHRVFIRLMF